MEVVCKGYRTPITLKAPTALNASPPQHKKNRCPPTWTDTYLLYITLLRAAVA